MSFFRRRLLSQKNKNPERQNLSSLTDFIVDIPQWQEGEQRRRFFQIPAKMDFEKNVFYDVSFDWEYTIPADALSGDTALWDYGKWTYFGIFGRHSPEPGIPKIYHTDRRAKSYSSAKNSFIFNVDTQTTKGTIHFTNFKVYKSLDQITPA